MPTAAALAASGSAMWPCRPAARVASRAWVRVALTVIASASTEKCMCSRRSIIVDSMAMPIEPPRLRIMLESAEASAVSRGASPAVESWDSGMVKSGWPMARISCGRISWSAPTSWVRPTLIQQLAMKNKVPVMTRRRASTARMISGIIGNSTSCGRPDHITT